MLTTHSFTPDQTYAEVLALQEAAVKRVLAGGEAELLIGEHPPTITLGTSAQYQDVLQPEGFDVVETGRGGQVTLHAPGQLVAYPILNLTHYQQDLRWYVRTLQNIIVATLADFDIHGEITDDIGVWVNDQKIAAIGIRVRKWVTFHGLAINVENHLDDFQQIVPCGLSDKHVTSVAHQNPAVTLDMVRNTLIHQINSTF